MKEPSHFDRRRLLRGLGATAALAVGGGLVAPLAGLRIPALRRRSARAQASTAQRRFILCYFGGGWDLTLGPDSRDPSLSYAGIQLGTELLDAQYQDPFQVSIAGESVWWGAPMQPLAAHADVTTLFRGVNMNTVAHDAGRAYILTGLEPAGTTARGSSLSTHVVAQSPEAGAPVLPNLTIGVASYNQDQPTNASGIPFGSPSDLSYLLAPPPRTIPNGVETRLAAFQDCNAAALGPDAAYQAAVSRAATLIQQEASASFQLSGDTPEMQRIRSLYGLVTGRESGSAATAATAAQAIKTGLAQCVTVRLQDGLDQHTGWADTHPVLLTEGFAALAALLTDLRDSSDPEGRPWLESTTVVAFSEFSRTPRLNGADSRDHHFANSIMAFGAGLKPGVFGATGEDTLGVVPVDLQTGSIDSAAGTVVMPDHVYATLLASAGLDPTPYRVDPISAMLAGGTP